MQAILVKQPGDASQLTFGTHRKPRPSKHEIRVRVEATALNRADILQREGKYPPPKDASEILGLEMAGTVEAVGKGATRWKVGDRVFGLLSGGGYAEYVVLHEGMAMPIPEQLTFEQAAAIPEAFFTAFQALYWLGGLERGHRVLVHAGASGVGTAALQIAHATGATVYATASKSKHATCRRLGAKKTIDYHHEDFAERIASFTGKRGVDVILDFIGAPYFARNLDALGRDGRLVLLATMGGAEIEQFDLRALFAKRATVVASTLRSRTLDYKIRLTREFSALILPMLEDGRIQPVVDTVYHWKNVADAHRRMEANRNEGKIILQVK